MSNNDLNECQSKAMGAMLSGRNVFLTGAAGTGKSHLTRHFLKGKNSFKFPVLASTGAAALIIGGRTFHSFFGLGTMSGPVDRIVAEAMSRDKVTFRLKSATGVLIDEISMIPAPALDVAEEIARKARKNDAPWGGLQVIAVGDFRQLPPVSKGGAKEWCFFSEAWRKADFYPIALKTAMRASDPEFLQILNHVRAGYVTKEVCEFLDRRRFRGDPDAFDGTRLFGRRADVDVYNNTRLAKLPGEERVYHTRYWGKNAKYEEQIRKNAPINTLLRIKKGALVMIRINDSELRWVNGSVGRVTEMEPYRVVVELLNGTVVEFEPYNFSLKDGSGDEVATAENFPLNLAYATTIHKSQGCTLDRMVIDLGDLWEPGQAYVALSRAKSPESLYVTNWSHGSIKTDPTVTEFHRNLFPGA